MSEDFKINISFSPDGEELEKILANYLFGVLRKKKNLK